MSRQITEKEYRDFVEHERRLERQNQILVELARQQTLGGGGIEGAIRRITEAAARTLDVQRASVWVYDESRTLIRSLDLFDASNASHSSGIELRARDYPKYFAALEEERSIPAEDARTDPRTSEFTDSYLVPLGISSMLDAPIRLEGRLVGVVCHEHVGAVRRWHTDEQNFAASVADLVSLALQAEAKSRTEEELRRSQGLFHQAQKMEAVGRLAGGVAHDFNNLLTAILGFSKLALSRLDSLHPSREDIEEVIKAAGRAASLSRQLLAFSRKQVMQTRILDLNALVAGVDRLLRRLVGEDVELSTVLRDSAGHIEADPGQLEQVLLNLVVNSRDALPRGGRITLETDLVELAAPLDEVPAGRWALLAVSDTGTGMSREVRERLFEPYFTTKGPGKGTGMGLSTVYGIIHQSGGHIRVESEEGCGTTFRIYLPAVAAAPTTQTPPLERSAERRGSETICLVEDDDSVRALVRIALSRAGYTVLEAMNGPEALLVFERHPAKIDLLITDVVMPRMSGRELAERLLAGRAELRVLFMSGYTDREVVGPLTLGPGMRFIQKPFLPEALAERVREVLDERVTRG